MRLTTCTSNGSRARGFTLIELMVVVTVLALLALLAAPMYQTFVANTQIRSASESIMHGLRLAQAEAVKRNGNVEFALEASTGWTITDLSDNSVIARSTWADGAPKAVVSAQSLSKVQYDGLGRLRLAGKRPTVDDPVPVFNVSTSMSNADQRLLRIVVDIRGGGARMCDPKLPGDDPGGCPAGANS